MAQVISFQEQAVARLRQRLGAVEEGHLVAVALQGAGGGGTDDSGPDDDDGAVLG